MGSALFPWGFSHLCTSTEEQRVEVWFWCQKEVSSLGMGLANSPQGRQRLLGWERCKTELWRSSSSEAQLRILAVLQTKLSREQRGTCPVSGQICIFLIARIHSQTDDGAGLVLSSCLLLPLNIAKWSAINGHALNCLAQHVQYWEQEMITSGPLRRKPVEVSWGRVKI